MRRPFYKWGSRLLLTMLTASLLATLFVRYRYAEQVAARVWPQEKFSSGLILTAAPATRTVLLLGDSRMAQWGIPRVAGWRVVNAGIPGITTAQLSMCSPEILRQAQPQMVVIQAGVNDLKLLGVRPGSREVVIRGCVSNLLAVITKCRQNGAQVMVTTIWPTGPVSLTRRLVWSGAVDPAVAETNLRLRNMLTNQSGVRMVDLMGELTAGLSPAERFALYQDTLHLKPETYLRLSPLLEQAVASFPGEIPPP